MNTGEYRIRTDRGDAAAPLRLNGYGPRTSGTGGRGRAPDDRRHGGAGHLRLHTAPEVGEGVNSPRAVLGFSRA